MTASNEYGKALFEITEEAGTTDRVLGEMRLVKSAIGQSPDYVKLLDTPAIPKEERSSLAERAFGELDCNLCNLIMLLSEKHLCYLIPKIADDYSALYDESRGIISVEVISAIPLTSGQADRLTAKLGAITGKRIRLEPTVDPYVLGGIKVRYSGIQQDGTVRARLDAFEKSLKNTVI
ncbi:MAG: ATP synthase F1 subunit delta [Clostridia bacterium]|nr:ATP synthase F1 subunit delta [Clostridia bacterium]